MDRRSLLGHLVPLIQQPEPAATRALHYLFDAAPELADKFVLDLPGSARFEIGRIASEWQFGKVRPDVAILDAHGTARIFIENKFWAPLTAYQPIEYLKNLPENPPSVLAFIAPKDRTDNLWRELKERCERADLGPAAEDPTAAGRLMRVGYRTLVLTSWTRVLDGLLQAAGERTSIADDILQLRGLTERMNSDVFQPLGPDEPTDGRVARRLLNYGGLIDDITDKLVDGGVADTKGLSASGWGRNLRVRDRCVLYLGVRLSLWRDHGITPLWCEAQAGGVEEGLLELAKQLDGARRDDKGRLHVPIRLTTGVERARVIDDAVHQVERLAEVLLKICPPTTG